MATRTLQVDITGDTSDIERKLRRMGAAAGQSESRLSRVGRAGITAAKGVGIFAAAAGVAAAVEIKRSVEAATDLNEEISKSGVVFKRSGDDVVSWSTDTATSIGISQRAALEAAGVFGNMLVPMGLARDEAAQMSQRMVTLAGDMASFNNASPEETLDALRAGLAGETEPLRRYGVFLSAARVEQEAMNLGIAKGTGELDSAAKAQATYSLILKDTKDAQGDYGRTSEGLANIQRTLGAQVENVEASLGQAFLPTIEKVGLTLSREVMPELQATADGIAEIWGTANDLSVGEKLVRSLEVAKGEFGPIAADVGDEVSKALDKHAPSLAEIWNDNSADLGEKISDTTLLAIEEAVPVVAENAGQLGITVARGVAEGFIEAPILGKVFIGAAAIKMFGGRAALLGLGAKMGGFLGGGMAAGAAAGVGGGAAAGVAGGAAGAGVVGTVSKALKSVRWARVGGLGAGVLIGEQILGGIQGEIQEGSDDVFEALEALADKDFFEDLKADFEGLAAFGSGDNAADELAEQARELQGLLEGLGGQYARLSEADEQRIRDLSRQLDLSDEARAQVLALVDGAIKTDQLERATARIGDGFRSAFSLKDIRQNVESNLAEITANFDAGSFEVASLTRTNFFEARDRIREAMEAGRVSAEDGMAAIEQIAKQLNIKPVENKFGTMNQKAREAIAGVDSQMERWEKRTDRHTKGVGDSIDSLHQPFSDMRQKARKAFAGVGANVADLDQVARKGFQNIGDNANELGRGFNVKPTNFKLGQALSGDQKALFRQSGGPIFKVPGSGIGDIVDAMLPAGAFVVNRNASAAMGLQSGGAVRVKLEPGETVWPAEMAHVAEAANNAVPRLQGGGIVPVPGFPGERINKAVLGAWQALQKRFSLFLTDAYGPGHKSVEHTRLGTAVDVVPGPGGSWGDVGRAVAYAVRSGMTPVYYDGSGGSIDLPPHGPGHHAHLTLLTAAELASGQRPGIGPVSLPRPIIEGAAGPLRRTGQAALDKSHKGAERYLREQMASAGAHGPTNGPKGLYGKPQIRNLWTREGGDPGKANLAAAVSLAESSGNPRARNVNTDGSIDRGLFQINSVHGRLSTFDPSDNVSGAIKISGNGSNWSPWVAYNTGAYRQFLRAGGLVGGAAVARLGGGQVPTGGQIRSIGKNLFEKQGGRRASGQPSRVLSFEDQLTLMEIALIEAEGTDTVEDDLSAYRSQLNLLGLREQSIQGNLDNLALGAGAKREIRRDARGRTAGLVERLKKGGLSAAERRKIAKRRREIIERLESRALDEKRSELLNDQASILGQISSTRNSIEDLKAQEGSGRDELIEALRANAEAANSLAEAERERARTFGSERGIQQEEIVRALADWISGELGGRMSASELVAGNGLVASA